MKKLIQSTALALGVSLACGNAVADKIEMVDGVVQGVNVSKGYGTLRIKEDGTSQTRSFEVTPDTDLKLRVDLDNARPLNTYAGYDDISDLRKGDEVTIKVRQDETDGRWFVVGTSRSQPDTDVDVQVSDTNTFVAVDTDNDTDLDVDMELDTDTVDNDIYLVNASYNSLPNTATSLPMIALGGGLAVFAGLGLRARRRRS